MDTLSLRTQDDFSKGMFQSVDTQRIPDGGSYDIENGLLDADEGVIYRRGGSVYVTTSNASEALTGIWCAELGGGHRVVARSQTKLFVVNAAGTGLYEISPSYRMGSPAPYQGMFVVPCLSTGVRYAGSSAHPPVIFLYGGGRSNYIYGTGTVAVTAGSTTVTGTGTTWTGNVEAGSIFYISSTFEAGVVENVRSNTSITLKSPWSGATGTGLGYGAGETMINTPPALTQMGSLTTLPAVATAANRLFVGFGDTIVFSHIGQPLIWTDTDYHKLADGGTVTGLMSLRGRLLVFTTVGMYAIDNVAFDLTDAAGNPQQSMSLISGEVVTIGADGIAPWRGAFVVPCLKGVYLVDGSSSPVPISEKISGLYRSYLAAGYVPGVATVYNNTYILPMLSAGVGTATLVCDLASRVWSRASGYSGLSTGFGVQTTASASTQTLYSSAGLRVLDCKWFSPSSTYKNEADGTTHSFSVTTRDFTLSSLKAFAKKIRLWVEGVDAGTDNPTITASYAMGTPGSSFTSLGSTSAESTGDTPLTAWSVNKTGRRIRFKFSSTSPFASLKIKALDLFIRPRGRS